MSTKIDEKVDELRKVIDEIGLDVATSYTLADAIREGSKVTDHNQAGWGDGDNTCALSSAVLAAKARKYL